MVLRSKQRWTYGGVCGLEIASIARIVQADDVLGHRGAFSPTFQRSKMIRLFCSRELHDNNNNQKRPAAPLRRMIR